MISFTLNGTERTVDVDPDTPLLWVIRDVVGLTGTKFGCGIAQCGACTVHVDGMTRRSCVTPIATVEGSDIVTIEGLAGAESRGGAGRLGRRSTCRNAATASPGRSCRRWTCCRSIPKPTDADIDGAMAGNICRCATYHRIRLGDPRRRQAGWRAEP